MPRPGEDRSNVVGAAQFTNIGPVPLSAPREPAICCLPDFPEFDQAVRYSVPGTLAAQLMSIEGAARWRGRKKEWVAPPLTRSSRPKST